MIKKSKLINATRKNFLKSLPFVLEEL